MINNFLMMILTRSHNCGWRIKPTLNNLLSYKGSVILLQYMLLLLALPFSVPVAAQSTSQVKIIREIRDDSLFLSFPGAKEIVFNNEVCDLKYDSVSDKIIVGLRTKINSEKIQGKSYIYTEIRTPIDYKRWLSDGQKIELTDFLLCLDAKTLHEDWTTGTRDSKTFAGHPNSSLLTKGKLINYFDKKILTGLRNSDIIDLKTGTLVYRHKNQEIFGVFPETDLLLTLGRKDTIYGINLSDGSERWKFRLNNATTGWNDLCLIDDTTLVLSVAGLSFVNISTGLSVYLNALTTANVSEVIGLNGDRNGSDQYKSYGYDFDNGYFSSGSIWGLSSNVLYDNNNVYSASYKSIRCTDHTGKTIWEDGSEVYASSWLCFSDSLIVGINKGYAILPGYQPGATNNTNQAGFQTLYIEPFLIAFNRFTGKRVYRHKLSGEHDIILDIKYLPGNDTVQLITRNKIIITDISTGKNLAVKQLGDIGTTDVFTLAPPDVWLANAAGIYFPAGSLISNTCLTMGYNRLWLFDRQLNNVNIYYKKDTWHFTGRFRDMTIISNHTGAIVLSGKGRELLRLPATGRSCLVNSDLYIPYGNRLVISELENIPL